MHVRTLLYWKEVHMGFHLMSHSGFCVFSMRSPGILLLFPVAEGYGLKTDSKWAHINEESLRTNLTVSVPGDAECRRVYWEGEALLNAVLRQASKPSTDASFPQGRLFACGIALSSVGFEKILTIFHHILWEFECLAICYFWVCMISR